MTNSNHSQTPENTGRMSETLTSNQANRRRLLQMGAAGLPMMMTVNSGVSASVISQLDCLFTIPAGYVMMVRSNGKVWMGDSISAQWQGEKITQALVDDIKNQADITTDRQAAPNQFRPDEDDCPSGPVEEESDDSSSKGKGKGKDDDSSDDNSCTVDDDSSGKGDDSSDDSSSCEEDLCGTYKIYETTGAATNVNNYVDGSGNWIEPQNANQLYIYLMVLYAQEYGNDGAFPGISCIHSILVGFGQD
ncbi:hypothetical protein QGN29_13675 [Temperatibacter marinus]|uniref:Uncharacterized protein n=1 Tax=Temperatibacter marinus TaxID=1456591 RepID=A0AA52ED63_9PROT|nr:hypothetical protein [Temperatibacter marinus]WND02596.1 hypothetical protein QGN29_13675 [Temperatibacter marinus]